MMVGVVFSSVMIVGSFLSSTFVCIFDNNTFVCQKCTQRCWAFI
jgi:hypothetical protein